MAFLIYENVFQISQIFFFLTTYLQIFDFLKILSTETLIQKIIKIEYKIPWL